MMASDVPAFIKRLREATEDDIADALDCAYIALPDTSAAEALELFNCVLGPDGNNGLQSFASASKLE